MESSEPWSGQDTWNSLWPALPTPTQVQPFHVCVSTVSVSVLWLHSPRGAGNPHTALNCPWGCPLEQSRSLLQHGEHPEGTLCMNPVQQDSLGTDWAPFASVSPAVLYRRSAISSKVD